MKKYLNTKAAIYIALALVCAMAGTALGMANPQAEADTVVLTSPFTAAIEDVQDSVGGVYNYQVVSNRGGGYSYIPWDYFGYGGYGYGYGDGYGYGYGDGRTQPGNSSEVKYASGSGVVIAEGYVLTNFHVIEGASNLKIAVGGNDSDLYDAEVAAYDESKDIAVLYVPGLPVEPVELGDSDKLVVGDWAICIGNAVGFNGTVTAGIISGLDREVESDTSTLDRFGRRTNAVNTMIQTDAAINSGNSGGGLFNTAGQLVGIPTLKYSGMQYTGGAMIESIAQGPEGGRRRGGKQRSRRRDRRGRNEQRPGGQAPHGRDGGEPDHERRSSQRRVHRGGREGKPRGKSRAPAGRHRGGAERPGRVQHE